MTSKERCLAAVHGREVDRAPVFPLLMYLAKDRAGITYREYSTNGRAMAEAQILVHERYGVDAVTACSDAFRIAADLAPGKMLYPEEKPPYLAEPIVRTESDLASLRRPDPLRASGRMADRVRATAAMCRTVGDRCLVLGWVDMPFAEACSLCGVEAFMVMIMLEPALAHRVLSFLTDIVIDFAVAQAAAGAPMVGAGDAAASLVSPAHYREFALPYEQRVCEAVHAADGLVKLHICGDTSSLLGDMISSGADLFNVDHLVDFETACRTYGAASRCFKGNVDPVADVLQATPEQCQAKALECIRLAAGERYMLSGGCEIPAETPDETFLAFCQAPQVAPAV